MTNRINTFLSFNSSSSPRTQNLTPIQFTKNCRSRSKLQESKQQSSTAEDSFSSRVQEINQLTKKVKNIEDIIKCHQIDIHQLKQSCSKCRKLSTDQYPKYFKSGSKTPTTGIATPDTGIERLIQQQISNIRNDITSQLALYPNRQQVSKSINNIQSKIRKTAYQNYQNQINNLKIKIKNQSSEFQKDLNLKINNMNQANRIVFAQIEKDIKELLNVQSTKPEQFFISNKKFHSPTIIKYKEIVQRTGRRGKIETQTINQVTYYLDKDGFLLDSNHNYLIDKNGKQIKLNPEHLIILNGYQLIR